MWTGQTLNDQSTARNAVFLEIMLLTDRRVAPAQLHGFPNGTAKGKLQNGKPFIHESIIGSKFTGRIEGETTGGVLSSFQASKGGPHVYGYNT